MIVKLKCKYVPFSIHDDTYINLHRYVVYDWKYNILHDFLHREFFGHVIKTANDCIILHVRHNTTRKELCAIKKMGYRRKDSAEVISQVCAHLLG